jgi:hypothetical protein
MASPLRSQDVEDRLQNLARCERYVALSLADEVAPLSGEPAALATAAPVSRSAAREASPESRAREVLQLWLTWDDADSHLTTQMFLARHDQRRLEALADEVDRLRHQAVAATRKLMRR